MSNESHILRFATAEDIDNVSNVIRDANKPVALILHLTPENCPKHPSNCNSGWIADAMGKGEVFFILEIKGKVIGCIAYQDAQADVCYLSRLAVLPEFQKQGYGEKLTSYFQQYAKDQGKKTAGIGVINQNTNLKDWYKKIGYIETKIKNFKHLPFDVCFMEKKI
ncbi:MAG: GNAT family N-acetyltransferase [Spirochaetaceae bacterium]